MKSRRCKLLLTEIFILKVHGSYDSSDEVTVFNSILSNAPVAHGLPLARFGLSLASSVSIKHLMDGAADWREIIGSALCSSLT